MEDKRAQTLEALSTFIQAQKSLLARTQTDIERLRRLKDDALSQPSSLFLSNLSHELNASAFKLSQQLDCATGPPEQIDWSLYTTHDPTPFQTLASASRLAHVQRNEPHPTQRAPLSDLQKLVKSARLTLVDPILSVYHCPSDPSSEEEDVLDPEELKREREREKIRLLKGRKISSYAPGTGVRSRGPSGVFIRRDVEDESAEVDIDASVSPESDRRTGVGKGRTLWPTSGFGNGQVDVVTCTTNATNTATVTPLISIFSLSPPSTARATPPLPPSPPMAFTKSARIRRPSAKIQPQDPLLASSPQNDITPKVSTAQRTGRRKTIPKAAAKDEAPPPPAAAHTNTQATSEQTLGKRSRDTAKPRPETYKQAWTVEEQHLLEKLLDEIPDGEKNRWQKISLAMKGRRTPRQVASRVQKYFEKLKRFGVVDAVNGVGEGG